MRKSELALALSAFTIATTGCGQPPIPSEIPSKPAITEPLRRPTTIPTPEITASPTPEKDILDYDVSLLINNPRLQSWRARLPQNVVVRILAYKPDNRQEGLVTPVEGLKTRALPDTNAAYEFPWLIHKETTSWRFVISVDRSDIGGTENWVMLDETVREEVNPQKNYFDGRFAAMSIEFNFSSLEKYIQPNDPSAKASLWTWTPSRLTRLTHILN